MGTRALYVAKTVEDARYHIRHCDEQARVVRIVTSPGTARQAMAGEWKANEVVWCPGWIEMSGALDVYALVMSRVRYVVASAPQRVEARTPRYNPPLHPTNAGLDGF